MSMKSHIFSALREQLDTWEAFLDGLSEQQIATPLSPSEWTPKDEIAHLWAWQQRSIARMEAALQGNEPIFPKWLPGLDAEAEEVTDINAYLYETYRDVPWAELHHNWREQFLRLLELAQAFPEPGLLDSSRYAWMDGYSLADVLLGTYDHHQEHYEKLVEWLKK